MISRTASRRPAVAALAALLTAQVLCAAPTVNGLFYGDSDYGNYPATPYAVSTSGSKLFLTYINGIVYVALVVDRSVNDNTFDAGLSGYMASAGWQNTPTTAGHRSNSEFAEFTLRVVSGTATNSWNWQQGYAGQKGGGSPETRNIRTNATWRSDTTVSGGAGIAPPNIVSASSMMWNMNTYATMFNGGTNTWTMPGAVNNSANWKSPWNPTNANTVINADEGYPPSGQITYSPTYRWEWPMVYEWSLDLTQFGASPAFVVTGQSHHSPRKTTDERDDPFPQNTNSPPALMDFGDLPAPYATLAANNGARHYIDPAGAFLGTGLDSEADGQPDARALGDDAAPSDDEDGVELLSPLIPGGTAALRVTAGRAGNLSAFVDWDGNGTLDGVSLVSASGPTALAAGPISDLRLTNGVYTLTVSVPSAATNAMPARFRFTNAAGQGGNAPAGLATSGEVEDHMWPAALGDRVWLDDDGDGQQDAGEPGVSNVTVRLLDAAGAVAASTVTDASGRYLFADRQPALYRVAFDAPPEYRFTVRDAPAASDATDSDADPLTGQSALALTAPGQTNRTVDAGLYVPATVFGHLFVDKDGDLIRDTGDSSVTNALVRLVFGGVTVASTNTDAFGYYRFDGVPAGTVSILVSRASATLIDVPATNDVRRNRGQPLPDDEAFIAYPVTSGYGVLAAKPGEPLNFGFASYPLSSSVDVRLYATGNGGVMLELWTAGESGIGDIAVLAWLGNSWTEVGRVPASAVVGEGANRYKLHTRLLQAGGSYWLRIIDEAGKTHESTGPVGVTSVRLESLRLDRQTVEAEFNTEPGRRYRVLSSTDLDNWSEERVSRPTAKGWSGFDSKPFTAGGHRTKVRLPADGRPRAFFKVIMDP